MKVASTLPQKIIHRGAKMNLRGEVSALCFSTPRAINLAKASWTNRDDAVTCQACIDLLAKSNHTMKTEQKPIIVKKSVRHDFSPEEIAGLNVDFRQSFANLKAVESEFDNVKALWKSKTTEAESRMEVLNATLQAGFEMRQKDCVVVFRPADKKKDFYLFGVPLFDGNPIEGDKPLLTEEMTQADFEQDLIQAEAAFGDRVELILWEAGSDVGRMIVGSQAGKWFAAVRGNVGAIKIEERLDSEQMATKKRFDAITRAGRRVNDWLKANLGKDTAKGFEAGIIEVVEGEKERVE